MNRSFVHVICAFVGTLTASMACAQSKPADIAALHKEVEALRKSQEAMARDVADIKKILEALQGPPPVGPVGGRVDTLGAPEKGNARATVAIVEFSDYQCPFCKRHVDSTLPLLEENYIANGKVRYVFMDFPLEAIHPLAFKAAEASHCAAEQKQFWKMHDRLFANQDKLKPDQLMAHATALGLNNAAFGTCLASGKYAAQVKASLAQGEKFRISGTPAIILGRNRNGSIEATRMIVGALPFEVIKEEVDKLLAEPPKAR